MTLETHAEPTPEIRPDKELDILISSADEDREFDFKRSTTVGEAIAVAVNTFKLDPNDAYDLTFPKKPHQKKPSEPLPATWSTPARYSDRLPRSGSAGIPQHPTFPLVYRSTRAMISSTGDRSAPAHSSSVCTTPGRHSCAMRFRSIRHTPHFCA